MTLSMLRSISARARWGSHHAPQKFRQPDLAAMAVIARENLSRIFADWKRRKLVSLFGAQLGINLNVVSRFIASATYAVIRVILALTGNT